MALPQAVQAQNVRVSAARGTHEQVFRLLGRHLTSGLVLDVPCGTGAFSQRLVDAGYEVYTSDLAVCPAAVNARFQQADMAVELPFRPNLFDAVVSIEGIEHIYDSRQFVRECARVLRPGGVLLISTPNICSIRSRWRWFWTGFHAKASYPPDEERSSPRDHVNMMSLPELRHVLHTQGFRIVSLGANRIKPVSLCYAPLAPAQYLATKATFRRKAKNARHRAQMNELIDQLMRPSVLFGEILITVSRLVGKGQD